MTDRGLTAPMVLPGSRWGAGHLGERAQRRPAPGLHGTSTRTLPITSAGRRAVERPGSGTSGVGLRNSDLWAGWYTAFRSSRTQRLGAPRQSRGKHLIPRDLLAPASADEAVSFASRGPEVARNLFRPVALRLPKATLPASRLGLCLPGRMTSSLAMRAWARGGTRSKGQVPRPNAAATVAERLRWRIEQASGTPTRPLRADSRGLRSFTGAVCLW
jgi:hypothetical protein